MRALAAFLVLALSACMTPVPSAPAPPPAGSSYLSGTHWIMEGVEASPHYPTMNFEEARASGFNGCNQWFAGVTHEGESLRFGMIGTTRRACEAGSAGAVERRFLAMLNATRYAHYDQDALVLLDAEQHQIGRFHADR